MGFSGKVFATLLLTVSVIIFLFAYSLRISPGGLFNTLFPESSSKSLALPAPTTTSTPQNKVKYPQDFTLVLVGDSMTEVLGNSDELRAGLKTYYPDKSFEVLNYSFGSTNILSVVDRLQKETMHLRIFRPILEIDFDLIIIESFGHNPLSEYNLAEGLKKQTETLDTIVNLIKEENPDARIVFLATIAPNKETYGLGSVDLTQEKRVEWAEEREAYIKNHIDYANSRNTPLVNVFEKSKDQSGNGKLDLINNKDHIHPSPNGVRFISKEIADYIGNSKLLN